MDISLVIPAYNERENIPPLVAACREALDPHEGNHEIVLVDDGSIDGTAAVLENLAREERLLRIRSHPPSENIGCHPAELEGLKMARGALMLFLPADLQIHPSVLPAFIQAARTSDVVASYRRQRADPLWRRCLSAANNHVERVMMGVAVHDAHSSMALTRRAVDELVPRIISRSALIPAELLVRARRAGLSIAEVEIEHHPRVAGRQTGAKPSEILRVQVDLIRLRSRLREEQRAEH